MAKIAILGDTHLGARNASTHFSNFFNKFYKEIFYPYLVEHDIKKIVQLGDLFDNRTQLSIKAFHACKDTWFSPLEEHGIEMHVLLGNHDIFYKSSLSVNTPELLLKEYKNIIVYNEPTVVDMYGTRVAMIPWICDENKERVYKFLNRENFADLCCGHFEIDGFEMMKGVAGHGEMPRELFDRFELTLSGHYHTQSYDDYYRIRYTGTPYELTFVDMHDPKGFHVFDTETRQLEFIKNPFTMYERIIYSDNWDGDIEYLKDKAVKLIVEKKTDLYKFDRFVDSVKLAGVYDLQIIENFQELHNVDVDSNINVENSQTIINHYIDQLQTSVDKDRLKEFMLGLYAESISE